MSHGPGSCAGSHNFHIWLRCTDMRELGNSELEVDRWRYQIISVAASESADPNLGSLRRRIMNPYVPEVTMKRRYTDPDLQKLLPVICV